MKNKSILIIGTIVVVLIAVITIIAIVNIKKQNNNYEDIDIANIVNDNSNLPVKYMSKFDSEDIDLQKYERINNFMSKDFNNEDISFSYYGYPNDESEFYLGEIVLLTNKYNILGVTIGDNVDQAISKIEKYGFKLEENYKNYYATLKYKDFTIRIEADIENYDEDGNNAVIETIQLRVKSKYLGNRVY